MYGSGKKIIVPATCEHCQFVRARYNQNNPEGDRFLYFCGNSAYSGTPVYYWETCSYYQRDCLCYNQKEESKDGK